MLPSNEIFIRLALAAVFGSIIGIDRQRRDSSSGLRTHMLVCVGSCLIMIVSAFGFNDILGTHAVVLDPSRIAAQVISGIGFLGAGTILLLRNEIVRGLTTAAGLWTVAAIGLAIGGGLYVAAIAATGLTFIILAILKPIERRLFSKYQRNSIKIKFLANNSILFDIIGLINQYGLPYTSFFITSNSIDKSDTLEMIFKEIKDKNTLITAVEKLRQIPEVKKVSIHIE